MKLEKNIKQLYGWTRSMDIVMKIVQGLGSTAISNGTFDVSLVGVLWGGQYHEDSCAL